MQPRRILITGASGLLGINLTLEAAREHIVYGVVHSHPLRSSDFTVIQEDLLAPGSLQRLLEQASPDWVIHCAALANPDACEVDPVRARQLNTEIPRKLASLVARGGARLLHVSTDAVFDGVRGDYSEVDAPNPLSTYASTKLDGERAVSEANPQAIIARVNLFGWSLNGERSLAEFFYYNLRAGKSLKGFTDVYFCPLMVNDLAHVFLKMLDAGLSGLYHVVSSECISKYDFGLKIARLFRLDQSRIQPSSVADAGLKASRSPNLTLRSTKLASALGGPLPTIDEGLAGFYALHQQGYPQKLREMGR